MAPSTPNEENKTGDVSDSGLAAINVKNQNIDRYSTLLETDNRGLAWEWLRRDPVYQEFYIGCERPEVTQDGNIRVIRLIGDHDPAPWGLVFR